MSTKVCRNCLVEKAILDFPTKTSNGAKYTHSYCRSCKNDKNKAYRYPDRDAAYYAENRERYLTRYREKRANNVATCIWEDSRNSDRKKNRPNDLDKPFIEEMIRQPCAYCGETNLRMTLDRVDNAGGHTKDNVIQACYRCNQVRSDMPQEAWVFLLDGMRKAREAGAFGEWRSKPFSIK